MGSWRSRGPTADAVILARALGIPTLLYVEEATRKIHSGAPLILDALAGRLFIRPPPVVQREYARHGADLETHRTLLKEGAAPGGGDAIATGAKSVSSTMRPLRQTSR